jgi:hypothetical protein
MAGNYLQETRGNCSADIRGGFLVQLPAWTFLIFHKKNLFIMFSFTSEEFLNYYNGHPESLSPATIQAIRANYEPALRSLVPLYVAVQSHLTSAVCTGIRQMHLIRVIPHAQKPNQPPTILPRDVTLALLRSVPSGQSVNPDIVDCINREKLSTTPNTSVTKQQAASQLGNRKICRTEYSIKLTTPFVQGAMGIIVIQNPRAPDLPLRLRRLKTKTYDNYLQDSKNSEYINEIEATYNAPDPEFDTPEVAHALAQKSLNHGYHLHDELWEWPDVEQNKCIRACGTGCDCGVPNRLFEIDDVSKFMTLKTY